MINVKVLEEKENPVLKRRDFFLMLDHKGEATPKLEDTRKLIAEKFNGEFNKTQIVFMFSEKGRTQTKVKAFIWKEKIVEEKKKKKEQPEGKESQPEEKKEPEKKEKPKEKANKPEEPKMKE